MGPAQEIARHSAPYNRKALKVQGNLARLCLTAPLPQIHGVGHVNVDPSGLPIVEAFKASMESTTNLYNRSRRMRLQEPTQVRTCVHIKNVKGHSFIQCQRFCKEGEEVGP